MRTPTELEEEEEVMLEEVEEEEEEENKHQRRKVSINSYSMLIFSSPLQLLIFISHSR
jgi:hypothetical protein